MTLKQDHTPVKYSPILLMKSTWYHAAHWQHRTISLSLCDRRWDVPTYIVRLLQGSLIAWTLWTFPRSPPSEQWMMFLGTWCKLHSHDVFLGVFITTFHRYEQNWMGDEAVMMESPTYTAIKQNTPSMQSSKTSLRYTNMLFASRTQSDSCFIWYDSTKKFPSRKLKCHLKSGRRLIQASLYWSIENIIIRILLMLCLDIATAKTFCN